MTILPLHPLNKNEYIIIYKNIIILSQVSMIALNNSLMHMTKGEPSNKGLLIESLTHISEKLKIPPPPTNSKN